MKDVILASNSPRRRELFDFLGVKYQIMTKDVSEAIDQGLLPEEQAMELAFRKAHAVFKENKDKIVLGFDTLVYTETEILGKPKDDKDARRMLRILSGTKHMVVTGTAILTKAVSHSFYSKTAVTFYPLTDEEIDKYIASKEPMDKAGAYAVQGYGARFVERIEGDYYTVMGMPVSRIYQEFKKLGIML
ncbi:MAG: Maf family protein [Candidatus Izemoplasmatales bacterium]|jgi:septum formation protein